MVHDDAQIHDRRFLIADVDAIRLIRQHLRRQLAGAARPALQISDQRSVDEPCAAAVMIDDDDALGLIDQSLCAALRRRMMIHHDEQVVLLRSQRWAMRDMHSAAPMQSKSII